MMKKSDVEFLKKNMPENITCKKNLPKLNSDGFWKIYQGVLMHFLNIFGVLIKSVFSSIHFNIYC